MMIQSSSRIVSVSSEQHRVRPNGPRIPVSQRRRSRNAERVLPFSAISKQAMSHLCYGHQRNPTCRPEIVLSVRLMPPSRIRRTSAPPQEHHKAVPHLLQVQVHRGSHIPVSGLPARRVCQFSDLGSEKLPQEMQIVQQGQVHPAGRVSVSVMPQCEAHHASEVQGQEHPQEVCYLR